MNNDHIKLLVDTLQIPWIGSAKIPYKDSVVVWTHPFFSNVRLRENCDISTDLKRIKQFQEYQLNCEANAFSTITKDDSTTTFVGIGVSLNCLENPSIDRFRNTAVERYLKSKTTNPTAFFITTTETGVPTDSYGHFRVAQEGYVHNSNQQFTNLQTHLINAKNKYLTGCYADVCMSHTLGDISSGLDKLTILGHDAVFNNFVSRTNPYILDIEFSGKELEEYHSKTKSLLSQLMSERWMQIANSRSKTEVIVYDKPVNSSQGLPHHYQIFS